MSRYGRYDYDDRDYHRGSRRDRERDRNEVDIDIQESRSRGPERRTETIILERDRDRDRRDDRAGRTPDFLREDYGRAAETQQLVIREDVRDDDDRSRLSTRRRSIAPERVVEEEKIIIRDTEREGPRRAPYPPSDISRGGDVREELVFRERPRSRAPPVERSKEEIDVIIRRRDDDDARSVSSPRGGLRDREMDDTRSRHGDGDRRPTRREFIEEERIEIKETSRDSPPRRRDDEIDIRIRESERLGPPSGRARSRSRGHVVATEREEWTVRRPRREPSPPPRDFEKEEIIIRRKEREISPEPPAREPTPEPPALEPIVRPPIIQEVITHYRNIDHGFERAREPIPPPPPPSPPREKEEDLEIAIRRSGTRNGRPYDEEVVIERDRKETIEDERPPRRAPSVAPRREEDITWKRYNGDRTSNFSANERVYEQDFERRAAIPPPPLGRPEKITEETRIVTRRTNEEPPQLERARTKDRMWTEVTKDLVIKEAIEESGYEYEETEEFYYVMEYLRYEDVLRLVQLTDDIRRERRERIRELQWEREELERAPKLLPPPSVVAPPPRSVYDERIYEREYVYDRDGRRYRR